MTDPDSTTWLLDLIMGGEQNTWAHLGTRASSDANGSTSEVVSLLAKLAADEAISATDWLATSTALRRLAAQQPNPGSSVTIASVAMLRLSTLSYDDPGWASLMPRWLAAEIPLEIRGLGLLALAVSSRERLTAVDYSELMEEALHALPPQSALRAAHLHQFSLYLGLRGMLRRIADLVDLPQVGDPEPEVEPSLLAECFYDAVCCGRTAQAAFLARRIDSTPEIAWQLGLVQLHRVYIPLFAAVAAGQTPPDHDDAPSTPVVRALLTDDIHQLDAFTSNRNQHEISPLLGYDDLRIALARRDITEARTLIEARQSSVARHWLDDLFLARLLLLEDQETAAGAAFARVEASARLYGGLERIEIELRLASELTRHDCCRLGLATAHLAPVKNVKASEPQDPLVTIPEAFLSGSTPASATLQSQVAYLRDSSVSWALICGPTDGSRRLIADVVHTASGRNAIHCCRATSHMGMTEMADAVLTAADGSLLIDNVELLALDLQAWLADRIESGIRCRVILGGNQDLPQAVDAGRVLPNLYWPLAAHRVSIPTLTERRSDLPVIVATLTAALGSQARWESQALQAMTAMTCNGGWAELRALCACLVEERPLGTIDRQALRHARSALDGSTLSKAAESA